MSVMESFRLTRSLSSLFGRRALFTASRHMQVIIKWAECFLNVVLDKCEVFLFFSD